MGTELRQKYEAINVTVKKAPWNELKKVSYELSVKHERRVSPSETLQMLVDLWRNTTTKPEPFWQHLSESE